MEACPYIIQRGNDEDGRDGVAGNSLDKHEDQWPTADCNTPNDNGEVETESQYSPWMVVAKKRYGNKGTKKDPYVVGSSKSVWGAPLHQAGVSLERRDAGNKEWTKA